VPVESVVVPKACVAVSRNLDFDFLNPEECNESAYRISKTVAADSELYLQLYKSLEEAKPVTSSTPIIPDIVNASADSFYSSQGRKTSFPDQNEHLIAQLQASTRDLATLEMETHHLYHLAACWGKKAHSHTRSPPLTTTPVIPTTSQPSTASQTISVAPLASLDTVIRAAAAQMVFASRLSQDFITPEQVNETEKWTGLGVLAALCAMDVPIDRLHPEEGSVWHLK